MIEKDPIIRFEMTDEVGGKYIQESPLWDDELQVVDRIGWALNQFLRLVSYHRPNDYILMESLTEDEWYYLSNALDQYRKFGDSRAEVDYNADED